MLDRLETELVQHILSFVAAPDDPRHRSAYHRLRTLYACCLVSRRMRLLAQPLLWQKVELFEPKEATALVHSAALAPTLPTFVRTLQARGGRKIWPLLHLLTILPTLHHLEPLAVKPEKDIEVMLGLLRPGGAPHPFASPPCTDRLAAELRTLILIDIPFPPSVLPVLPFSFPTLTRLFLDNVNMPEGLARQVFRPQAVPALKILVFDYATCPLPCVNEALLQQLVVLGLALDSCHDDLPPLPTSLAVFFSTSVYPRQGQVFRLRPQYLFIPQLDHTLTREAIEATRAYLNGPAHSLKTLWVSETFENDFGHRQADDEAEYKATCQALFAECEAKDVEVHRFSLGQHWSILQQVSMADAFLRYVKEQRRAGRM